MKIYSGRIDRNSMLRVFPIFAGVTLNVILAYISYRTDMFLFADTAGTIIVAALGGIFPAIVTAVTTNAWCTIFNSDAIYFSVVNVLMAVITVRFVRTHSFKKITHILKLLGMTALVSGVLSALIQWGLLGGPQVTSIVDMVDALSPTLHLSKFPTFLIVNTLANVIDKGITIGIAASVLFFIPDKIKQEIKDSDWRQRPLSDDEKQAIKEWGKSNGVSLRGRTTMMLIFVGLSMVLAIGGIGVGMYFSNTKAEKTEIAWNAARFAADYIDTDKIAEYAEKGRMVPDYAETEKMLYKIRENSQGVLYLYVVRVTEEGCQFVFDLDTDSSIDPYNMYAPTFVPGEIVPFEEAFEPYIPALLAGEKVGPVESDDIWNWVLTVYYPVKDDQGNCVCYVGADVSLDYLVRYIRDFAIRALLIVAGFFILIISFGMRTTGIYAMYPINSVAECVEHFTHSEENQKALDNNVKRLRSLDIRTGDETEKLYREICDMALNVAEQMRDIRHYAEATAQMQNGLIITMADMVENRDSDTGAHIQKTAAYVKIIVEGLKKKGYYPEKITPKYMIDVVTSAPLHDVGKINISDTILNKPGKLTDEEYEIMKTHTTHGKRIMEQAISTVQGENYLKEARNMAAYHHERWDGKGYPEGLHGQVIPLSARIMAVADVFDALTSPRVYKPAFPLEKALEILNDGAGTQFDPKCVEVFMDALPEVQVVLKKYQDA